jgi:hypothetical protein
MDAAFGRPSNGQISTMTPSSDAPVDAAGNVMVALRSEYCDYEAVAAVLPGLLASGAVEEISEEVYWGSMVVPGPPYQT